MPACFPDGARYELWDSLSVVKGVPDVHPFIGSRLQSFDDPAGCATPTGAPWDHTVGAKRIFEVMNNEGTAVRVKDAEWAWGQRDACDYGSQSTRPLSLTLMLIRSPE